MMRFLARAAFVLAALLLAVTFVLWAIAIWNGERRFANLGILCVCTSIVVAFIGAGLTSEVKR